MGLGLLYYKHSALNFIVARKSCTPSFSPRKPGMGHERTFHTLIRCVRFSAGTRPHEAIG
jgi:hypothetical protein